jgi:hypothetical protein
MVDVSGPTCSRTLSRIIMIVRASSREGGFTSLSMTAL